LNSKDGSTTTVTKAIKMVNLSSTLPKEISPSIIEEAKNEISTVMKQDLNEEKFIQAEKALKKKPKPK
jgi:hypothetical protein